MRFLKDRITFVSESLVPEPRKGEYQGEEVTLYQPFRLKGETKKFAVYVENPETGSIQKIRFGDVIWYDPKNINKDEKESREEFWNRYECATIKDVTSPMFWSCHWWGKKKK